MYNSVDLVSCSVLHGVGQEVVPPSDMISVARWLPWEMAVRIVRRHRLSYDEMGVGGHVVGITDFCSLFRAGGITRELWLSHGLVAVFWRSGHAFERIVPTSRSSSSCGLLAGDVMLYHSSYVW